MNIDIKGTQNFNYTVDSCPVYAVFFFTTALSLLSIISTCFSQDNIFPVPAIEFNPAKYICAYTKSPIAIDGVFSEDSWERAPSTAYFMDIEGPLKLVPRFKTTVKMLWDDNYFYIAAELEEPDIWANLTQRDTVIFYDNDFEVFIDPDGDTYNYYEFEMNALNTVWDLLLVRPYRDGGPAVNGWDIAGLKTAVHINGTLNKPGDIDKGWSAEIAMPWKALSECANMNCPPKEGDIWRINFSRVEWQTIVENGKYIKLKNPKTGKPFPEDNWVWSPQGIVNMHYPEMWGFVQFTKKDFNLSGAGFKLPMEESVKWNLRKLYYSQCQYYLTYNIYTDNIDNLSVDLVDLKALKPWLKLYASPRGFSGEITIPRELSTIIIDQSGKTRIIQQ